VDLLHLKRNKNISSIGREIYKLLEELYPICRSITGDGVRQTLNILKNHIPLAIYEVPTGTKVFDWSIPKEWNINEAYIKNLNGQKIVDFKDCNLHVLNYSAPIKSKISLGELRKHLFTLPEHPDWIPYRTSYYEETWGFCLSHNQYLGLDDNEYEVFIDSSLEDGHLTYGEYYLEGNSQDEVLISCHTCHPSLCNDNLSGVALAVFLAKYLSRASLRYSYRFLFLPGTIGSVTWLCLNEHKVSAIKHGLVIANVGDAGGFTYKRSRQGNAEIDKAVTNVLKHSGKDFNIIDFFPYGYDERQYCSPGFNLPVGCLMRTPHGEYPEYHTSADNLNFVQPEYLATSFSIFLSVLSALEGNSRYLSLNPKCEPQMGKRGLYEKVGGQGDNQMRQLAMLWVLNLSDGAHTLLEISDRSHLSFELIKDVANTLVHHGLLVESAE
jgi:aminopeptidase-like protein